MQNNELMATPAVKAPTLGTEMMITNTICVQDLMKSILQ